MHAGIFILLMVWGLRALIWLIGQLDQFLSTRPAYPRKARARVLMVRMAAAAGLVVIAQGLPVAGAVSLAPVFVLICAPTLALRCVIPLGWPRLTFWIARVCCPLGFAIEATAGGVVYGALAFARKPRSPAIIEWLGRKLAAVPALDGGGVVASGLLAALRGDRDQARCLLLVANTMVVQRISASARTIARDWLVMEAARAGRWRDVIRLGRDDTHVLRWSRSVAHMAERIVGDPCATARWRLILLWMVAPRRRQTLPLLRRALASPEKASAGVTTRPDMAALPQALARFAGVLKNNQIFGGDALRLSAHAVNTALEATATRISLQQRLTVLGIRSDSEPVLAGFRAQLTDRIGTLIESCPHFAAAGSCEPAIADAIARVRRRLLRDVQAHCNDYDAREKEKHFLVASAEWGLWAVLRNSADRVLAIDPESETALFETMWPVCNNFAVFQHNTSQRTTFAYEIYSWLHGHSRSNPSAKDLLARNMRAALSPARA